MLKPKEQQRQHWADITDDELLTTELTTENPLGVPGLVTTLPEGDEEPRVEFSYDLRGSGLEEFSCVHGHHRHLKGYVFRKGGSRYLVGWICGESLYGTKFDEYTSDFRAAQTRQSGLCRLRDLRNAMIEFSAWVGQPIWLPAVEYYGELRATLRSQMPFVWKTLSEFAGQKLREAPMPRHLCAPSKDPQLSDQGDPIEGQYERLANEVVTLLGLLSTPNQRALGSIGEIISGIQGIIRRTEIILTKLEEVELFFQPATLLAISEHAESATPKRARHIAGILRLVSKKTVVQLPSDFRVPNRRPLEALIKAVAS